MVYIYGLKCPIAKVIRYIGKSLYPEKRHRSHIECARSGRTNHHTGRWIRAVLTAGFEPELVILRHVGDGEKWQDIERELIASADEHGWRLTNTTAGGEGLDYLDPADAATYRQNISRVMKELWNRPERRAEATQRSLKAWADPAVTERRLGSIRAAHERPELKARMREVGREIGARPEVKAAKSATMRATLSDPVRRAKHDAALSSDATRAKMSASAKERFSRPGAKDYLSTPEARARMSVTAKDRATPAYRAMMAEKTRASWEKRRKK